MTPSRVKPLRFVDLPRATVARCSGLEGVELWSFSAPPPRWSICHAAYSFILAESRSLEAPRYRYRREVRNLDHTTIIALAPKDVCAVLSTLSLAPLRVMTIAPECLEPASRTAATRLARLHQLPQPNVRHNFATLAEGIQRGDWTCDYGSQRLREFLFDVGTDNQRIESISFDHELPSALGRAMHHIERCQGVAPRLDEIATAAGVSKFYLERLFMRELGVTALDYARLLRLQGALALINQGVALTQVALEAGFCDQAHLTRAFKRTFALTPGQYRAGTRACTAVLTQELERGAAGKPPSFET